MTDTLLVFDVLADRHYSAQVGWGGRFESWGGWSPAGDGTIVGGHDVLCVGSLDSPNEVSVVSWGQRQRMTRAFYEKFNDEAWVPLSLEFLRASGLGLHRLNVDQLRADLAAL